VFRKGQGADAVAVGGEDGVCDGAENRWKRGFAEAGGRVFRFEIVDGNFGGRLRDSNGLIFVEIALHSPAAVNRDFLGHQLAERFRYRALCLISA